MEILEWILEFFLIRLPSRASDKQRDKYGPPDTYGEKKALRASKNVIFYIEATIIFLLLTLVFIALPIIAAVYFI